MIGDWSLLRLSYRKDRAISAPSRYLGAEADRPIIRRRSIPVALGVGDLVKGSGLGIPVPAMSVGPQFGPRVLPTLVS